MKRAAMGMAACVAGLLWPALAAAQVVVSEKPTLFPAKLDLDAKWDQFKDKPIAPASVTAILREDLSGAQLLRWGETRYSSLWATVDRKVAADPDAAAALREAQEPQAAGLVKQLDDLERILPTARRFPWAPAVHKALLRAAAKELRQGNSQLAARCFLDVLARSADDDLRKQAQVGLLLAAAHDDNPATLAAAFQGVDPTAEFPWLGGKSTAKDIQARLAGAARAAGDLKSLDRKLLEFPGAAASAYDSPTASAEGLAVSGPGGVSWFDGTQAQPAWSQSNPSPNANETLAAVWPGPYKPAVAAGRVFVRWTQQNVGLEVAVEPRAGKPPTVTATLNLPVNIAAFDARTGVQVWSTAPRRDWKELCPVSDPVYADGRLYLMATSRGYEHSPIFLVCLSAADGALLWKRELVASHTTVRAQPRRLDIVHAGNAVAVAGGSVYCQTNVGVVGCCDARDGAVDWLRTYPRDLTAGGRRPGSAPVVLGRRVVFLPRDSASALCLDAATGEVAWLSPTDEPQTIVGIVDGHAILASKQSISALDIETGKRAWDRPLPGEVDGRWFLTGSTLYAATAAKLFRIDARTGAIAEQADWSASKTPAALAVRGSTLYGIVPSERVAAAPTVPVRPAVPVAPVDPPVASSKTLRVVHRNPLALQIDGQPSEWDKFRVEAVDRASLLVSHDGQTLYVALETPAQDLAKTRLELAVGEGSKAHRWSVNSQGVWEGIATDVPPGVKGSGGQVAGRGALIYEVALPLEAVLPPRSPRVPAWGRVNLELVLRSQDPNVDPVRINQSIYLHSLTRLQEAAGVLLANSLPTFEPSWKFLEQSWRVRSGGSTTNAELYRYIIKVDPKAADIGHKLIRLDQALRKTSAADPTDDVLRYAEESGVRESARAAYRKLAGGYVSQWLYVEDRFKPQSIEMLFSDGGTFEPRVVAGVKMAAAQGDPAQRPTGAVKTASINGKTRMWIGGVEVDPKTRLPLGAPPASQAPAVAGVFRLDSQRYVDLPLPPQGAWHEWRVPLLALGLHDRPIHGVCFAQTGGSRIYWDRTAIVVDGKELPLPVGDDGAGVRLGKWDLADEPLKNGRKPHLVAAPAMKSETVRHSVTFKEGFAAHLLGGSAEQAFADAATLATIRARLPLLAYDAFAAGLYQRVDRASNPEDRGKLRRAILQRSERDDLVKWLEAFAVSEAEAGTVEPRAAIAALAQEAGLPEPAIAAFRDRSRFAVRDWQVIGPFPPSDRAASPAIEADEIKLTDVRAGANGKVGWKAWKSPGDRVDLGKLFEKETAGIAYAVCWIHSESKQIALLRAASGASVQVWTKSRGAFRPVLDGGFLHEERSVAATGAVELAAGWNQLLVRVESRAGRWDFSVELRDRDGGTALDALQFQATPGGDEK